MNKNRFYPFYLFIFLSFYLFISCTHDAYDSGDGEYSYLCAEFAELKTTTAKLVPEALTDDNEQLTFSHPLTVSWAEKGDTVYRALLYYNKVENRSPEPISAFAVPVLKPSSLKDGEMMHTDPLTLESSWTSANGKYLNLSLLVKTGVEEGLDARQTLGVVISNVTDLGDGTHHYDLVFYHHQNGVPEYYTTRVYSSIPTSFFKSGDTATLTIHTYQGTVVKDYQF